jgi:hypothetical protein
MRVYKKESFVKMFDEYYKLQRWYDGKPSVKLT